MRFRPLALLLASAGTLTVSVAVLAAGPVGAGHEGPSLGSRFGAAAVPSDPRWEAAKAVLVRRCLPCHGGERVKSEFRLSTAETFRAGGARGPVFRPERPAESRLLNAVAYGNPDLAMPPDGKLPDSEIATLRTWIEAGAPWPEGAAGQLADPARFAVEDHAVGDGRDWWAYQPLARAEPPPVSDPRWALHPIDAFVRARLDAAGLEPAEQAEPEALLRRATFDLTGLPPTLAERARFFAERESLGEEAAWAALIDRLLASPHYGEKWARHWLDLVRYGETNGYERDGRKRNVWRYRDWVIRALNEDLPYDRFVIHQLAGDELVSYTPEMLDDPSDPRPLLATGYFRLGVWDDEPADAAQARADEIADIVDTTSQVFLGSTMGCARCHDHKADPISQKDYYALTAYFNNVVGYGGGNFGQHLGGGLTRELPDAIEEGLISKPERERRLKDVDAELAPFLDRLESAVAQNGTGDEAQVLIADAREHAAVWRHQVGEAPDGWHTPGFDDSGWAEGAAGFGTNGTPGSRIGTTWDQSQIQLRRRFALTAIPRSLRLTIHHDDDVVVFLNGQEILRREGYVTKYFEVQLGRAALDALVVGSNVLAVSCAQDFGGQYVDVGLATGWNLDAQNASLALLEVEGPRLADADSAARIGELLAKRDAVLGLPVAEGYPAQVVAEKGREAEPQAVLLRGSVHAPADLLDPAVPVAMRHARASASPSEDWDGPMLPQPARGSAGVNTSGRRLAFAQWLVGEGRDLSARVMANRLWQFHFGRGLCRSPGDFGRLGERPTHPLLLDHVAEQLIERGWSLKAMHRYLMTSRAYRMSVVGSSHALAVDPRNDLFWRFDPRRLTAEEYRDAVLEVSGALNRDLHGPSVFPPLSEEVLATASRPDQAWGQASAEEAVRRSIYVHVKRSLRMPLLEALDQPDPDLACPERFPTNVPTQALMSLNGDFAQEAAVAFAQRLATEAEPLGARVRLAIVLALGREPDEAEVARHSAFLASLVAEHGATEREALELFCLALFNLNEFLWLD